MNVCVMCRCGVYECGVCVICVMCVCGTWEEPLGFGSEFRVLGSWLLVSVAWGGSSLSWFLVCEVQ